MLLVSFPCVLTLVAAAYGSHLYQHDPQEYQHLYSTQHQEYPIPIPIQHYTTSQQSASPKDKHATVLKSEFQQSAHGYEYGFESDNGIKRQEAGKDEHGSKAQGAYSYVGDDGHVYAVSYTADENGFQAHGEHLPTPHPLPEKIAESLAQNAAEEAAGIFDDGSYHEEHEKPHHKEETPQKHFVKKPATYHYVPSIKHYIRNHETVQIHPTHENSAVNYQQSSHQNENEASIAQHYARPAQHYSEQAQHHPQQYTTAVIIPRQQHYKQIEKEIEVPKQYEISENRDQQLVQFAELIYPQLKEYLLKETESQNSRPHHMEYTFEQVHPTTESKHKHQQVAAESRSFSKTEPIVAEEQVSRSYKDMKTTDGTSHA